ncbi:MAG: phosphatase PAP2 family protein [Eubacteriales bacterium]
MIDINLEMFKMINGFAGRIMLLDKSMIVLSTFIPVLFMISLIGFYLYGIIKKSQMVRISVVNILIFTTINLLISYIIGLVYFVPRPFIGSKVNLLFNHIPDASFPSDHAVGTMSIAIGIYGVNKIFGKLLIAISIFVGISRVYVGHHYPFDVIGGYLIVLLMNVIYSKTIRRNVSTLYLKVEKLLYASIKV